eukprot:TRINITY_DN119344_c0_g1_i1.p2 TRINITY_DN119344_c0_g1~~TRINITY_DN119344_c0_g1_i1.p2  ORF type:complete len:104 (-),score=14.89 TRINITY_DN119344_c0_g1_i1:881-1192(-)
MGSTTAKHPSPELQQLVLVRVSQVNSVARSPPLAITVVACKKPSQLSSSEYCRIFWKLVAETLPPEISNIMSTLSSYFLLSAHSTITFLTASSLPKVSTVGVT